MGRNGELAPDRWPIFTGPEPIQFTEIGPDPESVPRSVRSLAVSMRVVVLWNADGFFMSCRHGPIMDVNLLLILLSYIMLLHSYLFSHWLDLLYMVSLAQFVIKNLWRELLIVLAHKDMSSCLNLDFARQVLGCHYSAQITVYVVWCQIVMFLFVLGSIIFRCREPANMG